jgi:hypothetical protein
MCCWSAKIVNVITPPAEVTNVEASAVGAASDGGIGAKLGCDLTSA